MRLRCSVSDEPAHKDRKVNTSIYGAILIFAWYDCVPNKPSVEEIQDDVFECFMGGFKVLGKLFDLNKPGHMKLAGRMFKSANDQRARENEKCPEALFLANMSMTKRTAS